jgi:hypothetical protein
MPKADTFRDSVGSVKLDPRVEDIMRQAPAASPYNVTAFSGVAGRDTKTPNHPTVLAKSYNRLTDAQRIASAATPT